ncbi:DNA-directed RNA polymerase I subunit RPA2, partial [Asbolus verrucosus]
MREEPTLSNLTNSNFGRPPDAQNEILQQLGLPHVSSFNYMINEGLDKAVEDLNPVEFVLNNDRIKLSIVEAHLNFPLLPMGAVGVKNTRIYPSECRQRASTYKGRFVARVNWSVNGAQQTAFDKDMGELPIMVKSSRCHLTSMSPKELVKHGDHEQEWGGYFIIKGHERLVRMLLMTRRNYPIAIRRSGWKMRGSLFSDCGITMRCVRQDQTVTTNVLHFVTDGTAKLMFSYKKTLYYAPLVLILKCLCDHSDQFIYQNLIQGYQHDSYYVDCVQNMLRSLHIEGLHTHKECKDYLGKMFRVKFYECPEWYSNTEVAEFILKKCILIHLEKPEDKVNMLAFMAQKLFVFVQDKCKAEGADAVMMQELLLGGHLYLQIIKEKLQSWLFGLRANILKRASSNNFPGMLTQNEMLNAAKRSGGLESGFENFMATGNLSSQSGLGLMQDKGLTIVAENINRMRYMSHFKAVHRGAFFQEMRTTDVRQLLPDAWGFICPVHTPDGSPCGLLNHLTMNCSVTDVPDAKKVANIPLILCKLGMMTLKGVNVMGGNLNETYVVQLDGRVIGYVEKENAAKIVEKLRLLKIVGEEVPNTLEIVLVPLKKFTAQFPGLYLFTGPARMMRPLLHLKTKQIEFVGTFEQVYMNICVSQDELYA